MECTKGKMTETFLNTSVKQYHNHKLHITVICCYLWVVMGEFVQNRGKMLEHMWWRKYKKMALKVGALTKFGHHHLIIIIFDTNSGLSDPVCVLNQS